ncbi:MAG: DMT family transporter [Pseudomonadota bacterium]
MRSTDQKTGLAVICSILAMAVFGLVDNFIGLAAETASLWQFHFLRSALALILLLGLARLMGWRLGVHQPRAVMLRTFFAGAAMVIYFGCLGYMPIAQAVAGLFTAPLFVVIFSAAIWKERIGPRRISAVMLGFVGILLVLRPDASGIGPLSVMPLVAGAMHALGTITTRRWCADESTFALLGAFFFVMLLVGAMGMVVVGAMVTTPPVGADGFVFRGWTPLNQVFVLVVVAQSVGSLIGVGLIIRSYQLAEPSFIAVFENTMIVFATVWAFFLWGEWPDGWALWGIGLIILAGSIIALRTREPVPSSA